jgi:FMN phosphatase YigB (HAD superfamily)
LGLGFDYRDEKSVKLPYHILLLDMNGVFMFNEDRFGPEQDYYATYRSIGGSALGRAEVQATITECHDLLQHLYADPARQDDFPQIGEILHDLAGGNKFASRELHLLEQVFALHEVGEVPARHAVTLQQLARTYRLGIVSDIWSPKELWLDELRRAGVVNLFEVMVFSSDTRSVKPSRLLFERAINAFAEPRESMIFAGDRVERDIVGAQAAGLASIWIARGRNPQQHFHQVRSDYLAQDLGDLA